MTIPANETILAKDDWGDGNLFDQMNREYYAAYPGNGYDQGLYLNVYDDNFAAITFKVGSSIMNSAFELSESIFDPNRTQMHITCVYPVSGQYNTLSRALFYVLIVFSLVFRRHVWISIAALGTAMTYSAVSAVHLFALVGSFGFKDPGVLSTESNKDYVDLDIFGIFPILTAAGIMLTPILMWSNTVRKHHAQPVIVCWGALIFVALATCIGVLMRGLGLIGGGAMAINELPSFASCIGTPECTNPDTGILYRDFYQKCECFDFCGVLSPTAAMRAGENMVPFIISNKAEKAANNDDFLKLFVVNLFALAFITINGAIGVLESFYSQSEVRNGIFRLCNADLRMWIKVLFEGERQEHLLNKFGRQSAGLLKTKRKRVRFLFAKAMATMFYLLAILLTVLCPVVFITSVITSEILIQNYPPSEHSDAIGAWGAWVGAILVIFAAVIEKYSKAWLISLLVLLRAMWHVVKYDKKERQQRSKKGDGLSVSGRIKDFFKEVGSPFIHGWYSTRRAWWTSKTNMRLFAAWWKNPQKLSQMRGEELRKQWAVEELKDEGGKPSCMCRMCIRDLEKKLHGEDNTSEAHHNTVLDRARSLAREKRGRYDIVLEEREVEQREAYENLHNGPGQPAHGTEMSKMQQAHDDSTQASTLAYRLGESEESLYDRPTTIPLMSGSRKSVASDPSSPPAIPQSAMQRPGFQRAESGRYSPPAIISPALISPHQGPLPEAALDRRSGYARRDTDQSFGSFAGRRDSDQSPGTFARRDTEQSTVLLSRRDTEQSIGPVIRRDTDQSMGPITRRDTDQSIGPITRRDTDMSMTSRPKRKPVPSYIAPEGEEGMSWQRTMSPDQTSPRRDQAGSGS
ncbi:hypothetical protein O988_07435 [Pseudogymnoascus sp. VKM F-3808]|nr:hypothetical protein O988_07435 [Pseudogymnoascus sp. VKM F-3808]